MGNFLFNFRNKCFNPWLKYRNRSFLGNTYGKYNKIISSKKITDGKFKYL
jgi:hypothetical protein